MKPEALERVGLFPLPDITLLPCQLMPLHVFEPRYRKLIADTLAQGRLLAVPRLVPGYESDYHGNPAVHPLCGVGQIVEHEMLPDGRYNVLLRGIGRIEILNEWPSQPYRTARAQGLVDRPSSTVVSHNSLHAEVQRLGERLLSRLAKPESTLIFSAFRAASALGEQSPYLAGAFVDDPQERQALLEELDPVQRLIKLHQLLQVRADAEGSAAASDPTALN